ncbi:hypothetical protein LWM68_21950 [Niabella sp. W65]|nr:hypothetical protein [Niabella sp. W65]MCH7365193.1 hypothetical protein [Niabella sp. W65]ULT41005.1 hypothetical protein KRR40_40870 [Niabella sp. I65]
MKRSLNQKAISQCLLCLVVSLIISPAIAQKKQATPTTAAAHSHNDYLQKFPFWQAYYEGFGSVEADVFLKEGNLVVAHTAGEIDKERTLEALYLKPLQK